MSYKMRKLLLVLMTVSEYCPFSSPDEFLPDERLLVGRAGHADIRMGLMTGLSFERIPILESFRKRGYVYVTMLVAVGWIKRSHAQRGEANPLIKETY